MLSVDKIELLHRTPKVIHHDLTWAPRHGNRYRLEATVLAPEQNDVLHLSCNIGKRNHGFCLLYQGYVIRKYNKHSRHKIHATGQIFDEPHKQWFDEENIVDHVYIPADIDPDSDIDDQLLAFLREENITLVGSHQRLLLH